MKTTSILLAVLFSLNPAQAAPLPETEIQFEEKMFEITGSPESCQLTRAGMEVFKEPQMENGKRVGLISLMAGFYQTNRPDCMPEFGYVQWIKGCYISTRYNSKTGKLEQSFNGREHLGKSVHFVHRDWVVDSYDVDPLYGSSEETLLEHPEFNRHSFHYVFKNPLGSSLERDQLLKDQDVMDHLGSGNDYVFKQTPGSAQSQATQWVIRDIPSSGSLLWTASHPEIYSAMESSLEFKLCVYRTQDIPRYGMPAHFTAPETLGGPLHCFDWSVREGFNTDSLQMEPKTQAPEFCGLNP